MRTARILIVGGALIGAMLFLGGLPVAFAAPTAPDFTSATAISSCSVDLRWSQSDSADYFNFRIGSSAWTAIPGIAGTGAKQFIHEELLPEQGYSYQLQSCANVGGCSGPSTARTATTPAIATPPGAPTTISVVRWELSGSRVVLGWTPTAETAFSGFQVFRSDDAGANFVKIATVPLAQFVANNRTWSDAITTDAEHRYRIRTYQTADNCVAVDNDTLDSAAWVKFSPFSGTLTVPVRPATVGIGATEANGTRVKFTWANVANESTFQLQVSDRSDFSGATPRIYNANVTESEFIEFASERTFYYRVRACAATGNIAACSDYRGDSFVAGRVGPWNASASLVSLSDTTGEVRIAWEGDNSAGYEHRTLISRRIAGTGSFALLQTQSPACSGSPRVCSYQSEYTDRPARGERYEYEVKFAEVGTSFVSEPAVTPPVSLKFVSVLGWAWSSTGLGEGLGWFRMAYNALASAWGNSTQPAESVRYGVLADEQTGELSGYAWNNYGGWLSFNKAELAGCPVGTCEARLDPATGAVSGWAKLLNSPHSYEPNQSYWWVSLSSKPGEPAYGLVYATTTWSTTAKVFSGYAWGGDGVGWLGFGVDAPNLIRADVNPTLSSLTLEFRNPIDYDDVKAYEIRSDNPENVPRSDFRIVDRVIVPSTKTGVSPSQVTVPDLQADSRYGFFLRATKAGEVVESVVKSGKTSPAAPERYSLSCLGRTTSTITLGWSGNVSGVHTLTLYRSNTESGVLGGSRTQVAPPPALTTGSGTYQNTNLAVGTTYYYLLSFGSGASNVAACTTLTESSDAPSLLNVWPVNNSDLYVNWKDNATEEHSYTVERIRVTPRDSSFLDPRVVTESDSSLRLTWRNDSNRADEIGPFYHSFERSTSSTPFADPDNDGNFLEHDPSFSEVNQAFPEDTNPESDTNTYAWSNVGLEEGTVYSYRTHACSFIRVDLTKDGVDNPETTVCGGYSTTARASTKPAAPSNLQATGVETNSISLSFRDNSGGENGFELLRNGTLVHDFTSPSANKGMTVTYTDAGLSSGTTYSYEVRAYRFDPNVPTTRIYSANSNGVSVSTNVTLSVAKSPSVGGTVTGNGINCGTTCAVELGDDISVSLTAVPATGYTFSNWTGGQCADPSSVTCAFTIGTDVTVTANFTTVGGGEGGTVSVAATLNGSPVETSFNFSIRNFFSGFILVGPGTKNVPWSTAGVEEGRYAFDYNSGAPSGGTFSQISWSNSAGNNGGGSPGNTSISSSILPPGGSLSYTVAFVTSPAQKSPLDSFYAKIHDGITGVTNVAEKIADVFRSALAKLEDVVANVATVFAEIELANVPGGGPINIDAYFARHVRASLSPAQYPSVLRDTGLEPNTVYAYRVKAVYTAGGETAYALEGAGKTIPSGGTPAPFNGLRICTKNSFCDSVSGTRVTVPGDPNSPYDPRQTKDGARFEGYGQCQNNNDCRDVHTSRQFFEER